MSRYGGVFSEPLHQEHVDLLTVLHDEIDNLAGRFRTEVPAAHGAVRVGITSPRTAIAMAIAGLLILTTPLLLPRHDHTPQHERELARWSVAGAH